MLGNAIRNNRPPNPVNASTTIGILSILLVGAACTYASMAGAPGWLAGGEAEVFLKATGLLGVLLLAEKMWR